MQFNNKIKIAISKDFDKANNLKKIKERIEKKSKMKDKNMILKYGVFACLMLVIVIIYLFNTNNKTKKIFDNGRDVIYINIAINNSLSNIDADIKNLNISDNSNGFFKEYDFEIINKDLKEKYSFINNMEIPRYLNVIKKNAIYVKENKDDIEYKILNNYHYVYENLNDNRKVNVSFSKDYEPIRDYLIESDSKKDSIINDIRLNVIKFESLNIYTTRFKYKDINFDIETQGITENEFVSLIKSIVR